ncbi:MAG: EAL domain-containing protein [Sulfuritalea sp.]|nr:EAL domain-containing protein [Sulfuritalea sp.]
MNAKLSLIELPQQQFLFIDDGRLQEAPTVRLLLRLLPPAGVGDDCNALLGRFLEDAETYALPVVDADQRPVALVDRKNFVEFFSKPYCRELFGRRRIRDLLDHHLFQDEAPIIVEESCNVEDVANIIIHAGMQHMATGFIICRAGHYLGIANGRDLLNVITQHNQAKLYYHAHYDSLTGLPNRVLFSDRLAQACREADRSGRRVALLFIDVDRFKGINDSFGHNFGDAVLREVAHRIKQLSRCADTTARLGGDEFVILMEDVESEEHVDALAQRVVIAMQEPVEVLGHTLVVTISVGSAIYPTDDAAPSPLLAKADAAMYSAKATGRNTFRKYSSDTAIYDPESKLLENDLRRAIENDELTLHFQPQVELASGRLCGVETLVRWRHPERGLVSPGQFIPVAEQSGLIVPLGAWVLRNALGHFCTCQNPGLSALRVSVNISPLQFQQPDFPEFVRACLAEVCFDPQRLELELTETLLMRDVRGVMDTLMEIRRLGVKLAIDDFGTGFSSLSYLSRFPIDRLKIDQSFVRDIRHSSSNTSIVRAIVALARSLSLDIVAEGIETVEEKSLLEELDCSKGQGFLFARPMPAEQLGDWIAARQSPA